MVVVASSQRSVEVRTWVATLRLLASSATVSSDLLSPRKTCIIESSERLTLRCRKGILIHGFQHASAEAILLCYEILQRERAVRVAERVLWMRATRSCFRGGQSTGSGHRLYR